MRPPSYSDVRQERREYICKYTGLSGVEEDNILEALYEHDIDPMSIDWEHVVGSAKEYGDRYEAVWNYLQTHYGIPRPWGYRRLRSYELKHKKAEYEFNAEQLRRHLMETDPELYRRAINALCYGKGKVPEEVERMIDYRGKEREEFIKVLCEEEAERREIVFMPVDEAVRRYEEGIRRFGVETYRQCGNLRGWYNVARCLHDAKKTKEVSLELMVRNFREAS